MAASDLHVPVLLDEVLELLAPERGGVFVDATLGMGGHAEAILDRAEAAGKKVRLIGIDQDQQALGFSQERLGERTEYAWGNFAQMKDLLHKREINQVDGILMDLGVSSFQIDTAERGFSFTHDGPLDMRMDQTISITAQSIVNTWPEHRLVELLRSQGEEHLAHRIVRTILTKRKEGTIHTTHELAELIRGCYPAALRYKNPHPAMRTFQAIRMQVNEEQYALDKGLKQAVELLAPGGRLVVISFHSLEDRPVKHFFRDLAKEGEYRLLNKKPLEATFEELKKNSRARSAKVRGIERLA